jgi:hypothetical protein
MPSEISIQRNGSSLQRAEPLVICLCLLSTSPSPASGHPSYCGRARPRDRLSHGKRSAPLDPRQGVARGGLVTVT